MQRNINSFLLKEVFCFSVDRVGLVVDSFNLSRHNVVGASSDYKGLIMANGDVYQVTAKQKINGNDAINVWYCRMTKDNFDSEDVALGFVDRVIPLILPIQSGSTNWYEVIAENLFDGSDKWVESISLVGAGAYAGDGMPLHDAVGVILNHDNPTIRAGAKRMAGMTESHSTTFGVLDTAIMGDWDTVMNSVISEGVAIDEGGGLINQIAEFVIVKSIPVIVEGVTGYRLPESAVEAVVGIITSAIIKPNVTTQVSRKADVGS